VLIESGDIRFPYDVTLAELTSRDEVDAVHDDGQIYQDVIAKLWQVYSSLHTYKFSHRAPIFGMVGPNYKQLPIGDIS